MEKNLMLRLKKICFNLCLEKTKHLHGQITTAITSKLDTRGEKAAKTERVML